MNDILISLIAREVQVKPWQVRHTLELFGEGATVPFVSRYRKEATGNLDEVQVSAIKDLSVKYEEVEKRKAAILESISRQGKLHPELEALIKECYQLARLEDLYLPYRPKRKTRASIAREAGLEPLAMAILDGTTDAVVEAMARDGAGKVSDPEEALQGARDIVAEIVSENADLRQALRHVYMGKGAVTSVVVKGKEEEGAKFRAYFKASEPMARMAPHRFLAILRGQNEGYLTVKLSINPVFADAALDKTYPSRGRRHLTEAKQDAYKRLIHPSLENECFRVAKEKADRESIGVFADNLRQLLLSPPLGPRRVMAIDPGFRTGCKVVCLSEHGALLHNDTVYPHPPKNERTQAMRKLSQLVEQYKIEVIAVGDGTAGRETEQFLKKIAWPKDLKIYVVDEDGASVYSASGIAREEFPQYDVTVRGAVSIGRRLMDPLAELVKIDPKSIGVGQYQHDVDQAALRESLDQTVISCVNHVGVNLNTASRHLLTYVSGLGPSLAQNIVEYRAAVGGFTSRSQLMEVSRLGAKAYEQCAGFLRIPEASNVLDNTAVHPERYALVSKMAADMGVSVADLVMRPDLRSKIDLDRYVDETVGLPTLQDIMTELEKPGRDPRALFKVLEFDDSIQSMEDLHEGMELPGIVTNVTAFGAFVDLGVHQDGLIHVSKMRLHGQRVSDPSKILKIKQHVKVRVIDVDLERHRIGLELLN